MYRSTPLRFALPYIETKWLMSQASKLLAESVTCSVHSASGGFECHHICHYTKVSTLCPDFCQLQALKLCAYLNITVLSLEFRLTRI